MSRPLRRTQAIAPFGPGAMVDFPGPVSLVHAGLDAWPFDEANPDHREFRIDDERRLAIRLGVDFFVQPPDFRRPERNAGQKQNLNLKLPFLRFPLWHVCPRCGRMHLGRYHDVSAPRCDGPIGSGGDIGKQHSSRKTYQVRFVAACENGHIQDFPWVEWIFNGDPKGWMPDGVTRWLRMTSSGSASLAGVSVVAEERGNDGRPRVVARRTLAGAFSADSAENPDGAVITGLSKINVYCSGQNPVLATGTDLRPAGGCGNSLYALLKSAANIYFPSVVSSIYIPEVGDDSLPQNILDLIDDRDIKLRLRASARDADDGLVSVRAAANALRDFHPESPVSPNQLAEAANAHLLAGILLDDRKTRTFLEQRIKTAEAGQLTLEPIKAAVRSMDWNIDPERLLLPLKAHFSGEAGECDVVSADGVNEETNYRQQEYRIFSRDVQIGYPKIDLDIRVANIADYGSKIRESFSRIALLHRLRETRAFDGFSRIYSSHLSRDEQRSLFMESGKSWLPAIVVRGEGIFLQFSEERLGTWLERWGHLLDGRIALMRKNVDAIAIRRHQELRVISPRFVLLHTFSHLLINQLVQDCGYGSASLRERIYSSDGAMPMAGILIYTAAGDAEGTMGGLVRMGHPDRLENAIWRALEKAHWCSTDPICMESKGQGPDSCNLAACHSCALLPETSCEEQNRLLDRGIVTGTIDQPQIGFFSEVAGY